MERILKGIEEMLTLLEAEKLAENTVDELLSYIFSLVDDSTDDEDERYTAKANFTTMALKIANAYTLVGVLMDPDVYLKETFPEGATVSLEDRENFNSLDEDPE